jgi:hypothetical protein
MYRYALTGYLAIITSSQHAPFHPVVMRDMEGSTDTRPTAKLEVTMGGSFTEACEAWLRHSLTCWTRVNYR